MDSTGSLTRVLTASTDEETTYFVYGIGLISQEDDSEVLYYHFNNIGSTVAVTNLDGKIKEKFEYGPYGELTSENTCGIIFLYNGEYGVSTDENGLYYMRTRYYNPEIKRFINQDVLTGSITDSPTLNRYAYVEGNPISLADPFGLSPAINWHSALSWLGLLTFVPGCQAIGIAANVINACLYFKEERYFEAICSGLAALPGLGGAAGKICSASGFSNAAMMIQKGTQIASNVGFMGTGFYTIGKMGYENYQKHVVSGEDFSFWDFVNDAVNGTFAVLSIYGGAKGLGLDKININVPRKVNGSVYIDGKPNNANTAKNPNNFTFEESGKEIDISRWLPDENGAWGPKKDKGGMGLGRVAPDQVEPGIRYLEGQYIREGGRVEPWKAYYDEYGRLIARTDYNAPDPSTVPPIPSTHHHLPIWTRGGKIGEKIHYDGEYIP